MREPLEWRDIHYFSNDVVAGTTNGTTTVTIQGDVKPTDFAYTLLRAAQRGEFVLNNSLPISEHRVDFSPPIYGTLISNSDTGVIKQTETYSVTVTRIVPQEET